MKISDGRVYFYYLYDVADEIDLPKVEALLKESVTETGLNVYRRLTPEYIRYAVAPVLIKLASNKKIELEKKQVKINVYSKIFDFGAIVFIASTDFKGSSAELTHFSAEVLEPELEKIVLDYRDKLLKKINPALKKPSPYPLYSEDYVVYHVKKLDKKINAAGFEKEYAKEIAKLIRFEKSDLSDAEIKEIWDGKASYYENDLVVVDYNAAFVFDAVEPLDVLNVLEYANIQLLELRYYDSVLDRKISAAYDDLERLKNPFLPQSYSRVMKRLSEIKLGIEEIIDKVDNTLKLVGDMYLVKVYSLAAKKFHLSEWETNVDKKLAGVEKIYSKLQENVNSARFTLLEVLMVLLEIIFILVVVAEIYHWIG